MEGVIHGNDLMVGTAILQIRIFSGSLNGTFHCFRTGIGEKDTIHAGYFFDLTSRLDGRHVVIIIGGVDHLVDLCFQRIVVCLVLIAQGKYSDSRYEIQIFFPIGVIQMYAFALIQNDLITVIGMQQVFSASAIYSFIVSLILFFLLIGYDCGTDTLISEDLQQQAVCQTSVQDMYAVYTITDSGSTVI